MSDDFFKNALASPVRPMGPAITSRKIDAALPFPEEEMPVPILLVDDREENLVALEAVLRHPGYRLHKAASGDDALRFLLDNIPALILMDVQMPGLDGYETAAILKSNPRTRDIPIIFLTAIHTDDRYLQRGYDHGAIDYIYKPYDSFVLRSKVAVLADLYRKTERLLLAEKALRESEAQDRDRRIAELELRTLRREQVEQKRYRNLVESIEHGIVWSADPQTMILTFVSSAAAKLTGHAVEDLLREPGLFLSLFEESDRETFLAAAEKATLTGQETHFEHHLRAASGKLTWFQTALRLGVRPDGFGNELRGLSLDISAIKNAEQHLAQAKRRSDLLSHTSLLLAESLEGGLPLRAMLRSLQEKAFDFCALETLEHLGPICSVASGEDARDEEISLALVRHPVVVLEADRPQTRVWQEIQDSELLELAGNTERAAALAPLGLRACLRIPLSMHGQILGSLLLAQIRSPHFSDEELRLAEDLAYRISSALENRDLYHKAESAIRLRDEFLSIASHELRTPLTPLKIRVQQMQRLIATRDACDLPIEQLGKTVETCHRQIERLSKLVDDLLDISRISRGQLSLHVEPFNFAELVRDIVARFSGQCEAAGCTVSLTLGDSLDVVLDISRVEQVIVNLLTNAIKYAPGKSIEISVRSEGDEIEFKLQDHGIGIAEIDQNRIFQRFERAVSSNHFGGLGLGLYIVSQILTAHGGRIQVRSLLGEGATFTVRLPRKVAAAAPPPAAEAKREKTLMQANGAEKE